MSSSFALRSSEGGSRWVLEVHYRVDELYLVSVLASLFDDAGQQVDAKSEVLSQGTVKTHRGSSWRVWHRYGLQTIMVSPSLSRTLQRRSIPS